MKIIKYILMLNFISIIACSPVELKSRTSYDYRQLHPITVNQQTASLVFDLNETTGLLRPDEEEEVNRFAINYLTKGQGPISISVPADLVNSRFVDQLEEALIIQGVSKKLINFLPFPQNVDLIALTHRQYVAKPTACIHRQASKELNKNGSHNFGCAYMNNLAMQIKNPYNLLNPKSSGAGDSVYRERVIRSFREGNTTQSAVGKNTQSSISN